jgi:hypothetical protein
MQPATHYVKAPSQAGSNPASGANFKITNKMYTKINLEDNGQDFLFFVTNENGIIIDAKPFQKDVWVGAVIPIDEDLCMLTIGDECPIHHPPTINYGFLKHKVISIEKIETYDSN